MLLRRALLEGDAARAKASRPFGAPPAKRAPPGQAARGQGRAARHRQKAHQRRNGIADRGAPGGATDRIERRSLTAPAHGDAGLCHAVAEQTQQRELQGADWSDTGARQAAEADGVRIVGQQPCNYRDYRDRQDATALERATVGPQQEDAPPRHQRGTGTHRIRELWARAPKAPIKAQRAPVEPGNRHADRGERVDQSAGTVTEPEPADGLGGRVTGVQVRTANCGAWTITPDGEAKPARAPSPPCGAGISARSLLGA